MPTSPVPVLLSRRCLSRSQGPKFVNAKHVYV